MKKKIIVALIAVMVMGVAKAPNYKLLDDGNQVKPQSQSFFSRAKQTVGNVAQKAAESLQKGVKNTVTGKIFVKPIVAPKSMESEKNVNNASVYKPIDIQSQAPTGFANQSPRQSSAQVRPVSSAQINPVVIPKRQGPGTKIVAPSLEDLNMSIVGSNDVEAIDALKNNSALDDATVSILLVQYPHDLVMIKKLNAAGKISDEQVQKIVLDNATTLVAIRNLKSAFGDKISIETENALFKEYENNAYDLKTLHTIFKKPEVASEAEMEKHVQDFINQFETGKISRAEFDAKYEDIGEFPEISTDLQTHLDNPKQDVNARAAVIESPEYYKNNYDNGTSDQKAAYVQEIKDLLATGKIADSALVAKWNQFITSHEIPNKIEDLANRQATEVPVVSVSSKKQGPEVVDNPFRQNVRDLRNSTQQLGENPNLNLNERINQAKTMLNRTDSSHAAEAPVVTVATSPAYEQVLSKLKDLGQKYSSETDIQKKKDIKSNIEDVLKNKDLTPDQSALLHDWQTFANEEEIAPSDVVDSPLAPATAPANTPATATTSAPVVQQNAVVTNQPGTLAEQLANVKLRKTSGVSDAPVSNDPLLAEIQNGIKLKPVNAPVSKDNLLSDIKKGKQLKKVASNQASVNEVVSPSAKTVTPGFTVSGNTPMANMLSNASDADLAEEDVYL